MRGSARFSRLRLRLLVVVAAFVVTVSVAAAQPPTPGGFGWAHHGHASLPPRLSAPAATPARVTAAGAAKKPGPPVTLCVGGKPKPACYPSIQAAVDAAHDGDTIKVAPGTYAGGVVIDVSVDIVGAGAEKTIIKGGGPVVTVFRDVDPGGLTVSIRGVTITGGVNNSKPDDEVTSGGGIWIPTAQLPDPPFEATGATVRIDDSAITGNTVTSASVVPPGGFCGPLSCGFNSGGGIDNGGVLTITDTQISGNTAGSTPSLVSLASGTTAGGIKNRLQATLVLRRSSVTGNHAIATGPNGQFANTGGIDSGGSLTIDDSVVSDNTAESTSAFSADVSETEATYGGIHVWSCCGYDGAARITNTTIRHNTATATNLNPAGLTVGFAGGIDVDGTLVLERSVVSDNVVRSVSAGDAIADGGGLEVEGEATIRDSLISHNSVIAEAGGGALAEGAGIANAGKLTLERTRVLDNTLSATGPGTPVFGFPSEVKGGGIWNGSFGGPSPELTLTDSTVSHNSLSAPGTFVIQGGGLFTDFPVTVKHTKIKDNTPDQCFGC